MPKFIRPYKILKAMNNSSNVMIELPQEFKDRRISYVQVGSSGSTTIWTHCMHSYSMEIAVQFPQLFILYHHYILWCNPIEVELSAVLWHQIRTLTFRCQFSHTLGGVEARAGYEIICRLRHTLTFLSSVIWPSLKRWEFTLIFSFNFLINCIIVLLGIMQCRVIWP